MRSLKRAPRLWTGFRTPRRRRELHVVVVVVVVVVGGKQRKPSLFNSAIFLLQQMSKLAGTWTRPQNRISLFRRIYLFLGAEQREVSRLPLIWTLCVKFILTHAIFFLWQEFHIEFNNDCHALQPFKLQNCLRIHSAAPEWNQSTAFVFWWV